MTRLLLITATVALVAGAGWHVLNAAVGAWAADQRDRAALVHSERSWTPPSQPGIHYSTPVVVDVDHPEGVRHG